MLVYMRMECNNAWTLPKHSEMKKNIQNKMINPKEISLLWMTFHVLLWFIDRVLIKPGSADVRPQNSRISKTSNIIAVIFTLYFGI